MSVLIHSTETLELVYRRCDCNKRHPPPMAIDTDFTAMVRSWGVVPSTQRVAVWQCYRCHKPIVFTAYDLGLSGPLH